MSEEKVVYEDPPWEEEMAEERSLVPVEPQLTMINVDKAVEAFNAYQRLCREILDDTDYAEIRGIKARKRSGWAKLRRFYGISIRVLEEIRIPPLAEWQPGQAFLYKFTVAGWLGNRVEHGDGACESEELAGSNIAPTEHNVRSKALTRAKNRVTSDLIGGGEVSAEELDNGAAPPPARRPTKKSDGDPLELIMVEANAQLEAMELESHYKDKAHTLAAIKKCGHKSTTANYFTEYHAQIVAELVERVKAKEYEA